MPALALPAVEIAMLALLCLLIYFGSSILIKVLTTVLPQDLPIIGDRLVRSVESAASWAESKIKSLIHAQLHWAAQIIRNPVASTKAHLNQLRAVIGSLAHMGAYIIRVVIPAATSNLVNRMNRLYNQAIAFTRSESAALFNRINHFHAVALAYTDSVKAALTHAIAQALADSVAFTKQESTALFNRVNRLNAEAVAYAHGIEVELSKVIDQDYHRALSAGAAEVAQLGHTVDQLYGQALRHADQVATMAATGAVGALEGRAAAVLAAAWPELAADVQALEAVIGTDLERIGSAVRDIDLTKARTIAEGLAVVTAVSAVTLRYMKECGVPNCKNLGGLGHVLHDLQLLIGGEALLSMVAEFVHNPEGAAHTVIDQAGNTVNDLSRNFRHLIGL